MECVAACWPKWLTATRRVTPQWTAGLQPAAASLLRVGVPNCCAVPYKAANVIGAGAQTADEIGCFLQTRTLSLTRPTAHAILNPCPRRCPTATTAPPAVTTSAVSPATAARSAGTCSGATPG